LTDSEYENIKQHASYSAQIVSSIENADNIVTAIRHHHEKWDGTGYPDNLAGEQIPLLARIIAIADAFDAMAAGRPYKQKLSRDQIIGELSRHSGTQFDPAFTDQFIRAFNENAAFREKIQKIYRRADQVVGLKGVRS
jgi:HD-GYP domain-containing protein (c-di-GMP phosphodiesterase class II)